MAFNIDNFQIHVAKQGGNSTWIYNTEDEYSVVMTAKYFNPIMSGDNMEFRDIAKGDRILLNAVASAAPKSTDLSITAILPDVVVADIHV